MEHNPELLSAEWEELPDFYRRYVARVKDLRLNEALETSRQKCQDVMAAITSQQVDYRYQPEKWTVREVVCHLIDTERIMAYRALRFARNDSTALEGFNEDAYVAEANALNRMMPQLLSEFQTMRKSTQDLFAGFSPEMFSRKGSANGVQMTVKTLGFIISGHALHHIHVLNERYGIKGR